MYLEIDRMPGGESIHDLCIVRMSIKYVEIGNSLSVEEGPSHASVESDDCILVLS